MLRYGAPANGIRQFVPQEVFLARLKLLIIMAKAFLKGYPMGDWRKKAVAQNSRFIFYEGIKLCGMQRQSQTDSDARTPSPPDHQLDHLFLQRAQLLATMCTSITENNTLGNYRQQALKDNIDQICSYLSDQPVLSKMSFLKVA